MNVLVQGPGAMTVVDCSDVFEGACDCAGNVEDILGIYVVADV